MVKHREVQDSQEAYNTYFHSTKNASWMVIKPKKIRMENVWVTQ